MNILFCGYIICLVKLGYAIFRLAGAIVFLFIVTDIATCFAKGKDLPGVGLQNLEQILTSDINVVLKEWEALLSKSLTKTAGRSSSSSLITIPLPHLDATTENLDEIIDRTTGTADFLGVSIDVNGKTITPEIDVRASAQGRDVTDRLKADGISPNPWLDPETEAKLDKLPPDKRATYTALGLAQWENGKVAVFGWDVATTLHWMQDFPANAPTRITVRHRPIVTRELLTDVGIDRLAKTDHCLDAAGEAALRKAYAANRPTGAAAGGATALMARKIAVSFGDPAAAQPIETVRLTIEKPKPDTIVAVCGAAGLERKSGGLTYEGRNVVPSGPVTVYFVDPPRPH